MDLADVALDLAAVRGLSQATRDPVRRSRIMEAKALWIDEFGLVDDPVDLLVVTDETDEFAKPRLLGRDLIGCGQDRRGDLSRTSARNTAALDSK